MIFWIVIALAVIAVVATYIYNGLDDHWGWAFIPASVAAVFAGLVGFGLVALATLIPGEVRVDREFNLRAISTASSVEGRFFLGSGYVNGVRTLNYIVHEDGFSRLGQAAASASRIYEDTDAPTVTEYTFLYSNGWVLPFDLIRGQAWDFHIPEGSVLEDFTVTNE